MGIYMERACTLPEVSAVGSPGTGAGARTGAACMPPGREMRGAGAGAGIASRVVIRLARSFAGTFSFLQNASSRLGRTDLANGVMKVGAEGVAMC